jgi:hypothetical protein
MDEALRMRAAALAEAVRATAEDLDRIAAEAARAGGTVAAGASMLDTFGGAALVHGWYTRLEQLFEQIVKDLNAAPAEGPTWHRDLLRAMGQEKPGVRPAVLETEAVRELMSLLQFRHLFRNLYVMDLDPVIVGRHMEQVAGLEPRIRAALDGFARHLDGVASGAGA